MRISQLIAALQQQLEIEGDLIVHVEHDGMSDVLGSLQTGDVGLRYRGLFLTSGVSDDELDALELEEMGRPETTSS